VKNFIAERNLFFSEKGSSHRRELKVRVSSPYAIDQKLVKFPVDETMAACYVEFGGMDEQSFEVYGMDSVQAVNMASNLEAVLERLSLKYDFFWATGEPYFEDD
jgi:hypothetical protein